LRKADLKFNGFISPRITWRVSFDAGKVLNLVETTTKIGDSLAITQASVDQRTRMLQDAALTMKLNPYVALDIGQQILPLSLEGTVSTANVETIERTLFISEKSRAIALGDIRDIGVSANGFYKGLEYHGGLFNEAGDAAGTTDPNDQKTLMARVAYHFPLLPSLQIGTSGGYQPGPGIVYRQRVGSEIQFKNPTYTFRTETMTARDGALRRFGWYALGAYRPDTKWQFAARYDYWDKDITGENVFNNALQKQIVGGGSYAFDQTAKVAANLIYQRFPNVPSIPTRVFGIVAFQAVW